MQSHDDDGNYDGDDDDNRIGATRFVQFHNASQPWQQPPWHLWGNSETVTARGAVVGSPLNTPGRSQLLKISYGRPETWHWVFQSVLQQRPDVPVLGGTVDVLFDVTIGIGRSVIVMPAFERHRWTWDNPARIPPVGSTLTTTTTLGNRLFSNLFAPVGIVTEPTVISEIVAQDIQVAVRLEVTTLGGLDDARVQVSGQLSPKTHVRPDWFLPGPPTAKYAGSETGGR